MKHKDSKNFPFLSLLYSLSIVIWHINGKQYSYKNTKTKSKNTILKHFFMAGFYSLF